MTGREAGGGGGRGDGDAADPGGPGATGRGDLNAAWGRAFVDELARAGVRHASVSPGSRSTPLVLALAGDDRIRCTVHLDERSGAFHALGIGKASGRPAAVVTTSGTAAANLFPAVVEAGRSGAPLLLLTADRPRRLRGTDANQTVDQVDLFGSHVRLFHDVGPPEDREDAFRYVRALAARAVQAALGRPAGPVHLNFPFDKPLQPSTPGTTSELAFEGPAASGRPGGAPYTRVEATRRGLPDPARARVGGLVSGAARGLLVCGPAAEPDRLGPAALRLAEATGWPLLADPLSGARFGPGAADRALGAYDLFLRSAVARDRLAPDLVLRFGGAPTSGELTGFLSDVAGVTQVAVDDRPAWPDHRAAASEVIRADPASACRSLAEALEGTAAGAGGPWPERWRRAEEAARATGEEALAGPFFEGVVLEVAARVTPADGTLFVGSSMPVRDLDAFGAPRDESLRVIGNRGASGIDGAVSTALGAAAAREGPAVAVLGDLALYHDTNGLRAAAGSDLDLVFVIIHNDGGGIFHLLPIREHEPAFTPYFATPHGLDFRHAARLHDLPYCRVGGDGADPITRDEVEAAIAEGLSEGGVRLVEVPSDREENRRRREACAGAVVEAVEAWAEG